VFGNSADPNIAYVTGGKASLRTQWRRRGDNQQQRL